jgi:lysophospholipid acyltransferase (LPLAT)-like uncharacterized protein
VRRPLQIAATPVLANYIKLAINTSTVVSDPPDWLARAQELHPSVIALWHGQFLLLPGIYPPDRLVAAANGETRVSPVDL